MRNPGCTLDLEPGSERPVITSGELTFGVS